MSDSGLEISEVREACEKLGVHPDSAMGEIRKAYRSLAVMYHPDKNTAGEEEFKAVNKAYEILCEAHESKTSNAGSFDSYQSESEGSGSAAHTGAHGNAEIPAELTEPIADCVKLRRGAHHMARGIRLSIEPILCVYILTFHNGVSSPLHDDGAEWCIPVSVALSMCEAMRTRLRQHAVTLGYSIRWTRPFMYYDVMRRCLQTIKDVRLSHEDEPLLLYIRTGTDKDTYQGLRNLAHKYVGYKKLPASTVQNRTLASALGRNDYIREQVFSFPFGVVNVGTSPALASATAQEIEFRNVPTVHNAESVRCRIHVPSAKGRSFKIHDMRLTTIIACMRRLSLLLPVGIIPLNVEKVYRSLHKALTILSSQSTPARVVEVSMDAPSWSSFSSWVKLENSIALDEHDRQTILKMRDTFDCQVKIGFDNI